MRRLASTPRGTVHGLSLQSEILAQNPLGDPTQREHGIWTPPNWRLEERLPLLVDLTGYLGAGPSHTNWRPVGENVPERLDRLSSTGMARAVVAFPDCFTSLYGNQYLNSDGVGPYEDFICDEVVPAIEDAFQCGGEGRRGLFGKSSGGFGAAWHAMHRAKFWNAVAINSADMGFDALWIPLLYDALAALAPHGGSIEAYVRHVEAQPKIKDAERIVLMTLAMSAFFDPDLTQFRSMRLPLDPHTGAFIPERWQNWLRHDPVNVLDARLEEMRKLGLIYLDCGSRDQYRLYFGMRRFHRKLERAGIAHHFVEFDDDHTDIDYRMDVFLPLLAAHITG